MLRPASHVATAYTRRYMIDIGGKQYHDQYALFHPNGLVVVGIAPSHALFHLHVPRADVAGVTGGAATKEQKEGASDKSHCEVQQQQQTSPSVSERAQEARSASPALAYSARAGCSSPPALHVCREESSLPRLILVDYELGGERKVSRLPSGKRKRGGDVFSEEDILCRIRVAKKTASSSLSTSGTQAQATEDTSIEECIYVYEPRACVKGKVLEMNDSLMDFRQHSQLDKSSSLSTVSFNHGNESGSRLSPLLTHCGSSGYLCVLQPLDEEYESAKKKMITPGEYVERRREVLSLREYEGEEFMDNGMREKQRGPAVQILDTRKR